MTMLCVKGHPVRTRKSWTAKRLDALAQDIEQHPECLRPVTKEMVERVWALVGDIEVDLDAPLPEDEPPDGFL